MTSLDVSWRFEPSTVMVLVLVVGIALAVMPYAHRSLRGDRHGTLVTGAIGAMLSATALLVVAGELWMVAVAWSGATAATLTALGAGGGRSALRRGAPWLLGGDAFLWAAVVLAQTGTAAQASAVLLVLAAAMRCAVPPAHPWLIDSLYASTPVSAALHGGIVNGGGILVITQFDLIADNPLAVGLLAALGASAIVAGGLATLVRTDVKGRLVTSTIAQMGFTMLVSALGLLTAALLHLVAHGFYKSALFLSSNDGIDRRAAERRAPRAVGLTTTERRARAAAGGVIPVTALTLVAVTLYPGGRGLAELLLLVVVGAALAAAGARAAILAPSRGRAATLIALLTMAAAAFASFTSALTSALALTRPDAPGAQPLTLGIALLTLAALATIAGVRRWAPNGRLALRLITLGHALGTPAIRLSRERDTSPVRAVLRTRPRTPIGASA